MSQNYYVPQPRARCVSDGRVLGILSGYDTPPLCIKCGVPCSDRPIKRTFYWHESWVYVFILLGLLLYAIIALCIRKTGSVYLYVCPEHRKAQGIKVLIGWLTCLGLIGLAILGGVLEIPVMIGISVIAFFIALIVFLIINPLVKVSSIDNTYVYLRNVPSEVMYEICRQAAPGAPTVAMTNAFPVEVAGHSTSQMPQVVHPVRPSGQPPAPPR